MLGLNTVHSQKVLPELPYEIWQRIVDFLDSKTVRGLYSLNSTFLDISMNERYHRAVIGYEPNFSDLSRDSAEIRDEYGATRVRHLVIKEGSPYKPKRKSILQRIYRNAVNVLGGGRPPPPDLLMLVPYLTSVEVLEVRIHRVKDSIFHPLKLTILERGWPAYGTNLRRIELHSPLEELASVLKVAPNVPQLEHLYIHFRTLFRTTDCYALIQETILPFVKRHLSTIKVLTFYAASENLDMSALISQLPHMRMPSLTQFSMHQIFTQMELTDQARFLQAHSQQLRSLCLGLRYVGHRSWDFGTEWFEQRFWTIPLPNLDSIEIDINVPMFSALKTQFFKRYVQTLASIRIHRWPFQYAELYSVFSDIQDCSRMRSLDLRIRNLSPDVLRLFAENLTNLHELTLEVQGLRPVKDDAVLYSERVSGFCRAMEATVFPDWQIYSLCYTLVSGLTVAEKEPVTRVLFAAFPNLQLLCGERR